MFFPWFHLYEPYFSPLDGYVLVLGSWDVVNPGAFRVLTSFSKFTLESNSAMASSPFQTLTRSSAACSQESPWPTWTPAWQVTRRQPPLTPARGSTCWTWSPLARQSHRQQTLGNSFTSATYSEILSSLSVLLKWSNSTTQRTVSKINLLKVKRRSLFSSVWLLNLVLFVIFFSLFFVCVFFSVTIFG